MPYRTTASGALIIEGIRWGLKKVVFPKFSINLLKIKDRDCEPFLNKTKQPFEEKKVNCQPSLKCSLSNSPPNNGFVKGEVSPERQIKAESKLLVGNKKRGRPRKTVSIHGKELDKNKRNLKVKQNEVRKKPVLRVEESSHEQTSGSESSPFKNPPVLQQQVNGGENCHNLGKAEHEDEETSSFEIPDRPVLQIQTKLGKSPKADERNNFRTDLKMPMPVLVPEMRIWNGNSSQSRSPELRNGDILGNPTNEQRVSKSKVELKSTPKSLKDVPLNLPLRNSRSNKSNKKQKVRLPQDNSTAKAKSVLRDSKIPALESLHLQNNGVKSVATESSLSPGKNISKQNTEKSPVLKVPSPESSSQKKVTLRVLESLPVETLQKVNDVSKPVIKPPAPELPQERNIVKKPIQIKPPPPKQIRVERKPRHDIVEFPLKRKRDDLVVPEVAKLKMPFKIPRRVRTPTPPPPPDPPSPPPCAAPVVSAPAIPGGVRVRIFPSANKGNEPVQNGRPKTPPRLSDYPPTVSIKENSNPPLQVVVEGGDNSSPSSTPRSEPESDAADGMVSRSPQPSRSPSPASSEAGSPQRTTRTEVPCQAHDDDDMDVLDLMADSYDDLF